MSSPSDSTPPKRNFQPIHRAIYTTLLITGLLIAGRVGVEMAASRTDRTTLSTDSSTTPTGVKLTLGSTGEPVYLGEDPEMLRAFFNLYSTPQERARADLSDRKIRRINSYLNVTTQKIDADIVEVRIQSGAIAGAEYWVHHTQIPNRTAIDPILSPVPDTPGNDPTE